MLQMDLKNGAQYSIAFQYPAHKYYTYQMIVTTTPANPNQLIIGCYRRVYILWRDVSTRTYFTENKTFITQRGILSV